MNNRLPGARGANPLGPTRVTRHARVLVDAKPDTSPLIMRPRPGGDAIDISSFKTSQIFPDKDASLNRYERYRRRLRSLAARSASTRSPVSDQLPVTHFSETTQPPKRLPHSVVTHNEDLSPDTSSHPRRDFIAFHAFTDGDRYGVGRIHRQG